MYDYGYNCNLLLVSVYECTNRDSKRDHSYSNDSFSRRIMVDIAHFYAYCGLYVSRRTPGTLAVRTVTSTPFARFEIHKVRTESGQIVNDWLWTDERSHVNILV